MTFGSNGKIKAGKLIAIHTGTCYILLLKSIGRGCYSIDRFAGLIFLLRKLLYWTIDVLFEGEILWEKLAGMNRAPVEAG